MEGVHIWSQLSLPGSWPSVNGWWVKKKHLRVMSLGCQIAKHATRILKSVNSVCIRRSWIDRQRKANCSVNVTYHMLNLWVGLSHSSDNWSIRFNQEANGIIPVLIYLSIMCHQRMIWSGGWAHFLSSSAACQCAVFSVALPMYCCWCVNAQLIHFQKTFQWHLCF